MSGRDVGGLWISDAEPGPGEWGRRRDEHGTTGRWPLIVDEGGSWAPEGLDRSLVETRPGDHYPGPLLADWWRSYARDDGSTAPFDGEWPGLAPSGRLQADPDVRAAEVADRLVAARWVRDARLGLCASGRSADVPADLGWGGPLNYENDTARFSTVLRNWEERFGVRVVALGHARLHLSVAAPPIGHDHALRVAVEHFAFCPDNVWQGANTLNNYAQQLVGATVWSFWWD